MIVILVFLQVVSQTVNFSSQYSYLYYADRDDRSLIDGENRAFIDYYSMTFPKEDRATIFEYACMPGNEEIFKSAAIQKKLQRICRIKRKRFGSGCFGTVSIWSLPGSRMKSHLTMTDIYISKSRWFWMMVNR